MDGSGFVLCLVRLSDHGDSARYETIGGLLSEFLCPPLSANLASLLCGAAFHVCGRTDPASVGWPRRVRSTIVAVVGLSVFRSEFSNPESHDGHGLVGCHVVTRGRGAVLLGVAVDGAILHRGTASQDRHRVDLFVSGSALLCVSAWN